jgi:ATP-dependent DNA helicase DinG
LRLTIAEENTRLALAVIMQTPGFSVALDNLLEKLMILTQVLESQAERSEGLENCWQRSDNHLQLIRRWRDETETQGYVRWIEVYNQALQLNATPLSIAEIFQKQMAASPRAWIFTSATLSVKKNFTHYNDEMGLTTAQTACWESPFNFAEQALLYVPVAMPEPHHKTYIDHVVQAALPVLRASRGRAFFLCTRLRAMQRVYELLLSMDNLDFPCCRGDRGRVHICWNAF